MLFAVHISDNILEPPFWIAGFALTGLLGLLGGWRIREEEVPRIGLITAALFVASLIHVRIGPTSVHLLMNGLAGVVLGVRAAVAIPIGVAMQAFLFGHGGFTTIGVTSAIMVVPAVLSGVVFRALWTGGLWRTRPAQFVIAFVGFLILGLAIGFVSRLLGGFGTDTDVAITAAMDFVVQPYTLAIIGGAAVLGAWVMTTWKVAAEFAFGLALGEITVVATVALNFVVLVTGSAEGIRRAAAVPLAMHLPIAVIEGLVLGFALEFLQKVKPELLMSKPETPPPAAPPIAPGPH